MPEYEIGFGSQITIVPEGRQFGGEQAVIIGTDLTRGDFHVVPLYREDPHDPATHLVPSGYPGILIPETITARPLPGPVPYGDVATVVDGLRLTPATIATAMVQGGSRISQDELVGDLTFFARTTEDIQISFPG